MDRALTPLTAGCCALELPAALAEHEWRARAAAHRARIGRWTGPHRNRRRQGQSHPVLDFLFTYYSHPPSRLERWDPGLSVALAGASARERLAWPGYAEVDARDEDGRVVRAVGVDPAAVLTRRGELAGRIADLLTATAGRKPGFGCFGLHEWAMVYRAEETQLRHGLPLRLGAAGTAAVVDRSRLQCSHVDAYRFFTPAAQPLNSLRPTRGTQRELEQPGCLHATMDLYKWAYKLAPAVSGELVADCFELAAEVRELDMRASPYDLGRHGYPAVPIETAEGRAAYVDAQRGFAERGARLRQRLLAVCAQLLRG